MAEILVVEDEEIINELIRNLSLVGHHCESTLDGEKAVEIAKAKSLI